MTKYNIYRDIPKPDLDPRADPTIFDYESKLVGQVEAATERKAQNQVRKQFGSHISFAKNSWLSDWRLIPVEEDDRS